MTALSAENITIRGQIRPRTPGFVWTCRTFLFSALAIVAFFGSPIARIAAIATGIGAIWGDLGGGVRTAFRLFGALLAIWLAPTFGAPISGPLAARTGWHPVVCNYASMAIAGVGVLSIASILTWFTARAMRARAFTHGADRILGSMIGGSAGAGAVMCAVWTALTFETPIHDFCSRDGRFPDVQKAQVLAQLSRMHNFVMDDPFGKMVASVNPLPSIPMVATAGNLAKLAGNPRATEALLDDPRFRSLFESPEVRRHLEAIRADTSLRSAFAHRDLTAIMISKPFQDMLLDDELHRVMTERWNEIQEVLAQHADD